jgi:hypothetical protein
VEKETLEGEERETLGLSLFSLFLLIIQAATIFLSLNLTIELNLLSFDQRDHNSGWWKQHKLEPNWGDWTEYPIQGTKSKLETVTMIWVKGLLLTGHIILDHQGFLGLRFEIWDHGGAAQGDRRWQHWETMVTTKQILAICEGAKGLKIEGGRRGRGEGWKA